MIEYIIFMCIYIYIIIIVYQYIIEYDDDSSIW